MAQSSTKHLTDQEIEAIMFQSDDESELSLSDDEYLPPENQTSSSDSSSSDDEEVNTVDPQEVISRTSKTNIFWDSKPTLVGRTAIHNIVRQAQGAVGSPRYFSPKDVFCTFFSDNMAEEVLLCSNLEGRRIASAKNKSWKNISKEELYAYIGLLLLAGSQKSYDVPIRELFLDPLSDPHYKATMSVDRYEEIRRHIRFDDKRTRALRFETDKLAPISYIWNIFIKNCTKLYNPSANVTVDEQLVPFRGRCKFIQYMPSKPAKYGIKIFWMCDSACYYGINGVIYCGKEVGAPAQKDLGSEIVKTLAVPIFSSGRNITMDNYFTNVELGNFLLQKHITLVGTIKANRREIPEALKHNRQRALYESVFEFNNKATLVSYKAKKEKSVILLSTMHHNCSIDSNDRKLKPEIILYYNKTKGGVDKMDEMVGEYSCKRQTKRWPVVLFSNMLDVAALNSFIIYTENHPEFHARRKDRRRLFLKDLCHELVMPHMIQRSDVKGLIKQTKEAMKRCGVQFQMIPGPGERKRKRCFMCPRNVERKTERFCSICKENVCKEHSSEKITCQNCLED
ncbi:piggyBac transposable element-derived protein 4-like [Dendropsophus ebraccatus]|uniref:piggyBac transposable element-derived protein 4-like n=1 Tax=Dendropsophus ebraccatus TaxID=150705 RepID=UPI0038317677